MGYAESKQQIIIYLEDGDFINAKLKTDEVKTQLEADILTVPQNKKATYQKAISICNMLSEKLGMINSDLNIYTRQPELKNIHKVKYKTIINYIQVT